MSQRCEILIDSRSATARVGEIFQQEKYSFYQKLMSLAKYVIINLMKKNSIILVFFVGFLVLFAVPASAAGLIPDCGPGGCTLCDVWPLADNIIKLLLFGLAIPVLTITLIWGGVVWTTAGASPSNIEQGKKIMTSGIVGILIAFSGWLIVDTIIKTLASGGTVVGAWQDFPDKTACENPNLANEQITFEDTIPGACPAG